MGGAMMGFAKKRLRNYRVSWLRDGGMTMLDATETFQAINDKEAMKKAREIAGKTTTLKLEQFREIKNC